MWRAVVPAARSWCEIPGRAAREMSGWDVVRVSTREEVARSKVRTVWSSEAEYATVLSSGLKITACTGAVCESSMERGPRWGVVVWVLRRLVEGRREGELIAGPASLDVDQRPILPSAEAERMRFEAAWLAML